MDDERGRKILSNIKSAFQKDPEIDEYDFLPVLEPKHNCNPMVLVDHKLGLELWAARLMFHYAYKKLLAWRSRQAAARNIDYPEIIQLTRAVLLVNPDCATAWNIRKEMIRDLHLGEDDDLKLGSLVLTRHPKSPETFAHRKWILEQLLSKCRSAEVKRPELHNVATSSGDQSCCATVKTYQSGHVQQLSNSSANVSVPETLSAKATQDCSSHCPKSSFASNSTDTESTSRLHIYCSQCNLDSKTKDFIKKEMKVSEAASVRYANNYNAWCHRIWVLQHMAQNNQEILLSELKATKDWLWSHVSDHSGFHYRQYLLANLSRQQDHEQHSSVRSIIMSELQMTSDLITSYPGHEALWNHRRFVLYLMVLVKSSEYGTHSKGDHQTKKCRMDQSDFVDSLMTKEEEFCQNACTPPCGEWQETLAERHRLWLQNVLAAKLHIKAD